MNKKNLTHNPNTAKQSITAKQNITAKQEPLGWQKFKAAAKEVDHGKLLVTVRKGIPQVFSVVGEKKNLFP